MPIYMKFEGIAGTGTGNRKDWIELESCQLGTGRSVTSPTGRGSSREDSAPSISEIVITKFLDNSSPHLVREALHGTGKKVTIEFTKTDGTVYMTLELESTLISHHSVSGYGGGGKGKPIESLTLNYTQIIYTTKAADAKSSPDRAAWDLAPKQGS